jgi:hypothetical protein
MNLRARLRKDGINCIPWKRWKGEIDLMPISSKTLFRKTGIPLDVIEISLKEEGFIFDGEELLELLKTESNLYREADGDTNQKEDIVEFPEDWTDEDYIDFYERRHLK